MLVGLYIFNEDDLSSPVYAEPTQRDSEPDVWEFVCEKALALFEGDGEGTGTKQHGEYLLGWRTLPRLDVSLLVVVSGELTKRHVEQYLKDLARRYLDEVDDPINPDRAGVADVVVDVPLPWEEE